MLNTLIIDHCEDMNLSGNGVMHEGYYSCLFGLKGIPSSSEEVMIARNIILAEKASARIHIAHLSVKGAIDLIRKAKEKSFIGYLRRNCINEKNESAISISKSISS